MLKMCNGHPNTHHLFGVQLSGFIHLSHFKTAIVDIVLVI